MIQRISLAAISLALLSVLLQARSKNIVFEFAKIAPHKPAISIVRLTT